jgi:hypothetical protein
MTSERPKEAYVWIWLPEESEPVVAASQHRRDHAGYGHRPNGLRMSQVIGCLEVASTYLLSAADARDIVDHQIEVIKSEWSEVCAPRADDRPPRRR